MDIHPTIKEAIYQASIKTGVDESLLLAFAAVESNFGQNTLSPTGVRGLFQITGRTWRTVRKKHGQTLGYSTDVYEQAYTAALLIKELLNKYNNDRELAAIAYNAGEGVANYVKRHGKTSDTARAQAIVKIVGDYRSRGVAGFGHGKEKEIFNYPLKIAKALGEPVTLNSNITLPSSVTSKVQSVTPDVASNKKDKNFKFDKDKSFISNICAANLTTMESMHNIPQATINKSEVVRKVKAYVAKHKNDKVIV